ncbi:RNA polymerase sigma-D factor [Terrisporobacter petrolearius]|uniref:FliA/WhiG family RNA polymerase sigma factor n=2 Tax=Terrisporobacter hibernicus TaxID=2813371 RepID=A0AAX2ZLL7_9FIRM|nr:FliA/WhiG family RNA polymerase sigma factor [Terrisporobacter hibernicus]UEL48547.1 FliA/WhiG family RNA polymerase sigma factor [Terrisporobacter hibernicus]UPA31443.1 FliA/WhiG family RNA polymerase sigma factor [Terrisporobacter glycolicus]SFJ36670.1 RNA polymerase sigma factor for flagellar operon FliA [Terrisporobacter glycolicus]
MNTHEQEELIVNNMSLVRHIASKYYTNRIGMEYEDLVSYGVMGLIDASTKFDKNRGVKFSTFASIRISSYIIDEIRRHSPISRTYTSKIKEYNKCVEDLQNTYYRQPSLEEISKYMNISIKEANDIKLKMMKRSNVSLDGVIYEDESEVKLIDTIKEKEEQSPSAIIEKQELQEVMAKAIDNLKEKDKLVLSLYYYEEMTLKEIGLVLGVSESRVSQLNTRAISNLRAEMKRIKYID